MKNCKNIITFILLITPALLFGQTFSISLTSTQNEICNGFDCKYNGPTILINEVMMKPRLYDSSIKGCPPSYDTNVHCEGEWIELYNPHHCKAVDISCYYLGNSARDAACGDYFRTFSAGFILPEGTIVPPRGFVIVRGPRAPSVPPHLLVENGGNTIEIIVDDNRSYIEGCRFWFPNAGGWFAFYDENGVPQDAIAWGLSHNGADVNAYNPGPNGRCGYTGPLISYNQISADRKNIVSYIEPEEGKTFRRFPDGGDWDFNQPADETYGTCNADCIEPYISTCNGTATVTISGGVPPYRIFWDDWNDQTTTTAIELCEDTYCVTVIDANNDTLQDCVSVKNKQSHVTAASLPTEYCEGETIELYADASEGIPPFTYKWEGPDNFNSKEQNPVIQNMNRENEGVYHVTAYDSNGCEGYTSVKVTVVLSKHINIEGNTYYCYGENIRLLVSDTNGLYNVEWRTNNNFFAQGNSILIEKASDTSSGRYIVSALSRNKCAIIPDTIDIYVHSQLTPHFRWKPEYPTVRNPETYFINETEEERVKNKYTWKIQADKNDPENIEIIEDSLNLYYRWTPISDKFLQGLYKVVLISEGQVKEEENVLLECLDSTIYNVRIINDFLQFPNVVTPNGDGINDVFSIKNLVEGMAYPTNELYIYDRAGRKIFHKKNMKIENEYWNPKETNSPPGTYFYVFIGKGLTDIEYIGTIEVLAE